MPELPQIEALVRRLHREVVGQPALEVLVRVPETDELESRPAARPRHVVGARRFGKLFVVEFDDGRALLGRLMRWGKAGFGGRSDCLAHNPTFALRFGEDAFFWIAGVAPRFLTSLPTVALRNLKEVRELGVDPLSRAFSLSKLKKLLAADGRPLKAVLMHQETLAGLGNTWADEILFAARLAPKARGSALSHEQVQQLHYSIRHLLTAAVERYEEGGVPELQVHGRGGQPCPACGQPLRADRLGRRPTVWCSHCQVLPAKPEKRPPTRQPRRRRP